MNIVEMVLIKFSYIVIVGAIVSSIEGMLVISVLNGKHLKSNLIFQLPIIIRNYFYGMINIVHRYVTWTADQKESWLFNARNRHHAPNVHVVTAQMLAYSFSFVFVDRKSTERTADSDQHPNMRVLSVGSNVSKL